MGKKVSVGRDACSYRRQKMEKLKLHSPRFLYEIEGKIVAETEKGGRKGV